MSSFQPSTTLRHSHATKTATVISTTSTLSSGIESHPELGKWWIRNYGIGQRQAVKFVTRKSAAEHRFTSVRFKTASGTANITDLNFGGGVGGALVVAAGPRVSLYGGANRTTGTSAFNRALKAGSAAQKRRDAYDEDDDEGVDLFGGKFNKSGAVGKVEGDEKLDDIKADRNVPTGGVISECASHRSDGKLVAIGTEGGTVKICDANSRATLRTFHSSNKQGGGGDRKAVRAVSWLRDGKRVVAGGDDGLVRVWNVSGGMKDGGLGNSGGADTTLRGHGDKVTSVKIVSFRSDDHPGAKIISKKGGKKRPRNNASALDDSFESSTWSQLVVSGSYDHTIRVWDIESPDGEDKCVSIMNHGDPVQALLVLPPVERSYTSNKKASKLDNQPLLVSAGGTSLKIWNPFNGSCLGTFATKHAKTITSLCLLDIPYDESEDDDNESNRRKRHILTGGLDGLLRIHSATGEDISSGSLPFLHGMQIAEPISALALSSDMSRLAVGTTTGIVMVHQRRCLASALAASKAKAEAEERREPRHGTYSYFTRGAHEKSHDPDDYLQMHEKKQKLAEYDVLLRKFRYGDALDAVLAKRQPQAVIAVIEELGKRRGLTIALSNRDEETLDAILSFTIRFIDNPQYTSHLIGVAHILCDIYGSLRGQSAVVDELFAKLREKVASECSVQRMLLRVLGQIDFVMTTAEILSAEEQQRR
mmetsp:Transcript_21222/g.44253  ORF Transcript_21222/g.44253 Transcript_21222/m.44253 type:complete len:705 (+) Transcript_21222:322-2436(+)